MSRPRQYHKRQAKAIQRRRRTAAERLQRDRRQAQQAAEALQQALDDLGLPECLVAEIEGRLRSQHKLLGKICGVMFPPLFGCRTNTELCRVRGWDKNLPSWLLSALPKRSWIKRLRRLGLEVLVPLWRYAASASPSREGCNEERNQPTSKEGLYDEHLQARATRRDAADPPTLETTELAWAPGDRIPLGAGRSRWFAFAG
jgi:hypothetical protein